MLLAAALLQACGSDNTHFDQGLEVGFPDHDTSGALCAGAPLGEPCDDGSICTTEDLCDGSGRCLGRPATRERRVCDGLDDDCDGRTDEDCKLAVITGGFVTGSGFVGGSFRGQLVPIGGTAWTTNEAWRLQTVGVEGAEP